jgi:hypothetical protein
MPREIPIKKKMEAKMDSHHEFMAITKASQEMTEDCFRKNRGQEGDCPGTKGS